MKDPRNVFTVDLYFHARCELNLREKKEEGKEIHVLSRRATSQSVQPVIDSAAKLTS